MKRSSALLIGCFISVLAMAQTGQTDIAIIPQPVKLEKNAGWFILPQKLFIDAGSHPQVKNVAGYLKEHLTTPTGKNITISTGGGKPAIFLRLLEQQDTSIGKEGYHLQ